MTTHFPVSVADVVALVTQSAAEGRRLYPVSTGLNWGYGASQPPVAGCEIVNLSRMNNILNAERISASAPVAVIEPGVTQGQLQEFLARYCPSLTFNVTGSARDTSIIGNSLDRGVGYLGPRCEDLFGLEVVLGTGQVIQTGFRRLGEGSPLAHCHPHGLGPMLDGLFFQSNMGIVTSACFRLVPRRPVQVALSMRLRQPQSLAAFIDELSVMKREGLLPTVAHVGNRLRTQSTLEHGISLYLRQECGRQGEALVRETRQALEFMAPTEWSGLSSVSGSAAQVRVAVNEIRGRLKKLAHVVLVDEQRLALGLRMFNAARAWRPARIRAAALCAATPLQGLTTGVPTDAAIENLLWMFDCSELPARELEASNCGLLYINPAFPMDGVLVVSVIRQMTAAAASFGHKLYVTINIETPSALVAVTNLLFDRSSTEQCERAHRCADDLWRVIRSRGLEVYRARVDMMANVAGPVDSAYWATLRSIKAALDPASIIAPGRYASER